VTSGGREIIAALWNDQKSIISFPLLTRRGERSEMSLPKAEPYKAQGAPGSLVAPVCISRNLERAENQIETLRNSSSMYMSNAYLVENIRDSNIPVLLDIIR
jgi:hypothetical protein